MLQLLLQHVVYDIISILLLDGKYAEIDNIPYSEEPKKIILTLSKII